MKFALDRSIGYIRKSRLVIGNKKEDYFKDGSTTEVKYSVVVLIVTTQDFNMDDELIFTTSTSSIQTRPKAILKRAKGYCYRRSNGTSNETVYLTDEEVKEMNSFIEMAMKKLDE